MSRRGARRTAQDLHAILAKTYAKEAFVTSCPSAQTPQTRHVRGSNHTHIGVAADRKPGRAILVSALDNLVKGASGQAIQNMNVMLGYPETRASTRSRCFREPGRHAWRARAGQGHRYAQEHPERQHRQNGGGQEGRAGELDGGARPGEGSEQLRRQHRPADGRDPHDPGDGALQFALGIAPDPAGHQGVDGRHRHPLQGADQDQRVDHPALRGEGVADRHDHLGVEADEGRHPLADTGDQRAHEPALHDGRDDPERGEREPDLGGAPVIAVDRVIGPDGRIDIGRQEMQEQGRGIGDENGLMPERPAIPADWPA